MTPHKHPETWITPSEGGIAFSHYRKTFDFPGEFIDDAHARYAHAPPSGLIEVGIPGWLRVADALKLYEMAYFSQGQVLEIGAYHGLSTSILALALRNAGRGHTLVSLELDPPAMLEAKRNVADLAEMCDFILGDARVSRGELKEQGRTFAFAFVDHSHMYELVRDACVDLKKLIRPGGFALFHDFNDPRNGKDSQYGVYQAVVETFADETFVFHGVYGCAALYRRSTSV